MVLCNQLRFSCARKMLAVENEQGVKDFRLGVRIRVVIIIYCIEA